jgi:hypothetical protein
MIIDCDRCTLRGLACANCAVTFITGGVLAEGPASPRGPADPGGPAADGPVAGGSVVGHGAELDAAELRALTVLANAGMIPPLRYARAMAKAS